MRASTFDAALEEAQAKARDEGFCRGQEAPTIIMVADAEDYTRQYAMMRVQSPNGDRRRVHRIAGIQHLQGFRGGVLLCAHGTPHDLEVEARRRGMTLINMEDFR